MTYLDRLNALEAERINVTRERTGFAIDAAGLTAEAYEKDLAEARRRIANR